MLFLILFVVRFLVLILIVLLEYLHLDLLYLHVDVNLKLPLVWIQSAMPLASIRLEHLLLHWCGSAHVGRCIVVALIMCRRSDHPGAAVHRAEGYTWKRQAETDEPADWSAIGFFDDANSGRHHGGLSVGDVIASERSGA